MQSRRHMQGSRRSARSERRNAKPDELTGEVAFLNFFDAGSLQDQLCAVDLLHRCRSYFLSRASVKALSSQHVSYPARTVVGCGIMLTF